MSSGSTSQWGVNAKNLNKLIDGAGERVGDPSPAHPNQEWDGDAVVRGSYGKTGLQDVGYARIRDNAMYGRYILLTRDHLAQ